MTKRPPSPRSSTLRRSSGSAGERPNVALSTCASANSSVRPEANSNVRTLASVARLVASSRAEQDVAPDLRAVRTAGLEHADGLIAQDVQRAVDRFAQRRVLVRVERDHQLVPAAARRCLLRACWVVAITCGVRLAPSTTTGTRAPSAAMATPVAVAVALTALPAMLPMVQLAPDPEIK